MAARLKWGCSSVGRAPALQAGGHEFESHHLHSIPLGIVILYLENCILINLIITLNVICQTSEKNCKQPETVTLGSGRSLVRPENGLLNDRNWLSRE